MTSIIYKFYHFTNTNTGEGGKITTLIKDMYGIAATDTHPTEESQGVKQLNI